VPVASFDAASLRLAAAFWPGPLTLVLPVKGTAGMSGLVTAGLETVAVRVPEHPVAQALLKAVGRPLAAPSANPSGRVSPTTAHHVLAGLRGRIAAVIDGGPCAVGLESTIVAAGTAPVVLRPGGLPADGRGLPWHARRLGPRPGNAERAGPAGLALRARGGAAAEPPGRRARASGCWASARVTGDLSLSPTGDLVGGGGEPLSSPAAARRRGRDAPIAVAPIPDHGLGRAINDRLRRAAAP
jgi:L-threonylcarbamoyladenylate synthase